MYTLLCACGQTAHLNTHQKFILVQKRADFADFCRFAEIMESFSLEKTSKLESSTNPALQMNGLTADGALLEDGASFPALSPGMQMCSQGELEEGCNDLEKNDP